MNPVVIVPRHTGRLSVAGVGRVGTYEAARAARRCRARQHWVIQEELAEVKITKGDGWESRTKQETREDLGTFKTKKAAILFLLAYAQANKLVLEGDTNGYPWLNVPKPLSQQEKAEQFVEMKDESDRAEVIDDQSRS